MNTSVSPASLTFLQKLRENNNKDWMQEHKKEYQASEASLKELYAEILKGVSVLDEIEKQKNFRINRDVRFSKNKTPYNSHRSVSWSRLGAHRRGSYYLRIEPGMCAIGGGFFGPEPKDLLRIRKEFEMDSDEIRAILAQKDFKKFYKNFNQAYLVKTAPKSFSKEDPNIDLIRLKSFFVVHEFTDTEVKSENFATKVVEGFELLRPYFDYMSDVLTTDLNGASVL
ncbi:MAG: hypothetical protein ACJAYD_000921 [Patiriisocius sp.]|jgi:uncharacterized protein (TIGR02453 family)